MANDNRDSHNPGGLAGVIIAWQARRAVIIPVLAVNHIWPFKGAGGGEQPAQSISEECSGYVSLSPDVRVYYEAASAPLIFSVGAEADTTLVVNAADGQWYCDDDGGENSGNPALRFDKPQSGRYGIWIGSYISGDTQPARLQISEIGSQ